MPDDPAYDEEIISDETIMFLAKIQSDEGFSNENIVRGAMLALCHWCDALPSNKVNELCDYFVGLTHERDGAEPHEINLARMVEIAEIRLANKRAKGGH